MKLPSRRNLVLIILIISFIAFPILAILLLAKKDDGIDNSSYWQDYNNFYEFRTEENLENEDTFSVKGYVVLSEILEEDLEQFLNLQVIAYHEDIFENKVLPIKIALDKTNLLEERLLTLERGNNILITIRKMEENIYIKFSPIDLLNDEKDYLWNLFNHLENSYEKSSGNKLYDPITLLSVEELAKRDDLFTEQEILTMTNYLENIRGKELDLEHSFAPCFISSKRGTNFVPSSSILNEDFGEYEDLDPSKIVDSMFIESLKSPNLHKLIVENYYRKLADRIRYCKLNYERNLGEFNNLLKYTSRYDNINRETVKWIAEIVKELEELGYSDAKFSDFQIYFDNENYFNIEEDKFFRECILNSCSKRDVLSKVSMYLKNKDGEKTFNNGDNDIDLAISLTLLSILYNE